MRSLYIGILALVVGLLFRPFRKDASSSQASPAPPWLSAAVKALPRRSLDDKELSVFRADGVVVVRNLVSDIRILEAMADSLKTSKSSKPCPMDNEVLKAFVMDGPVGLLAASALNVSEVVLFSCMIFAGRPRMPDIGAGDYLGPHVDVDSYPGYVLPFVSIWLALIDMENPLEFIAGSHISNLKHKCPCKIMKHGSDAACIARLEGRTQSWDVKAGDAIVFRCQTYHLPVFRSGSRFAVSFRIAPADHGLDFYTHSDIPISGIPRRCSALRSSPYIPVIFPVENSTVKLKMRARKRGWIDKAVRFIGLCWHLLGFDGREDWCGLASKQPSMN